MQSAYNSLHSMNYINDSAYIYLPLSLTLYMYICLPLSLCLFRCAP